MSGSTKKKEIIPLDGSHSGFIRFEVDKVSTLDENGRFIADIEVKGVPLTVKVGKQTDEEDDVFLALDLSRQHTQSTPWSFDVKIEYSIVNADSSGDQKDFELDTIDNDEISLCIFLMEWDDLVDEQEGFIKDDKITIEASLCISDMRNIRFCTRIDFTDAEEPSHDVTLLIGGEKIYVNKGILAVHSPFFKAMFYGSFDEKNKKEIELKGVDRKEFLDLLEMIYPSNKKVVTDTSVGYLLKLGDQFQIEHVMELAEYHLQESVTISGIEKLRIADKYPSEKLLKFCLSKFRTAKHFKDIKESPIYADLSSETKVALFERMVESTETYQSSFFNL